MRTKFFNFASTGRTRRFAPTANCYCLLLLCPLTLSAQTNITISDFSMSAGGDDAPTTLTFDVQWSPPQDNKVWSDTVWVFVDYNNAGAMTRLPLALNAGATLTQHSAAGQDDGAELVRLEEVPGNDNGVWVVGNARNSGEGSFSATVQLLAGRDVARHVSTGMCIYAINYPPVGTYTSASTIKFNGTPPFYLTYSNGNAATVTKSEAQSNYILDDALKSFTDASRAPGVINCKTPATQTLQSSATTYCADAAGVTLSLSGTEKDAVYRLIKEGTGVKNTLTGDGSPATFTGTFEGGTYHVETAPGAFCPATLTSQVTVTEVPLPAITHLSSSGSPTQSVTFGASITDIKFLTTNASSVTVSGLASGIVGAWASNTLTISGNLSALGTNSYTVTTVNSAGCANTTVAYALKANVTPAFINTNTYSCNNKTWSSFVTTGGPCTTTAQNLTTTVPACFTYSGQPLYNIAYLNTYRDQLCPDGWQLPTATDLGCSTNNCRTTLRQLQARYVENGSVKIGDNGDTVVLLAAESGWWHATCWNLDRQGCTCGATSLQFLTVRCVKN